MAAPRKLEYVCTAEAGSLVELRNVYIQDIVIENWDYELACDSPGVMRFRQTESRENTKVTIPAERTTSFALRLAEQAYIFGDGQVIIIRSTNLDRRALVAIGGSRLCGDLTDSVSVK